MNPIVSSHGYSDAKIYFLAGFPFKDDLSRGVALSGTTESTLNSLLRAHNFSIKQCYRGLYIREKLDYSGTSPKKLKAALDLVDAKGYEEMLFQEIADIKPNVIVPMDDMSLGVVFPHIHTMKKPRGRKMWLNCYRGSVLNLREDWQAKIGETPKIKVIPTYAPNHLYVDPAARAYVSIDFGRIVRYKESTLPAPVYGMRWVCRSTSAFIEYIRRSLAKNPAFLVFDIETYLGMITCIGFSFDGLEGVSVPLLDTSIPRLERACLWQQCAKLLAHPIPKVNQNIKYDWVVNENHGFYVENVDGDTMIAASLLYPELPKGLDFLTSIYTDIPYYKDEGKEFNPAQHKSDRLYLYNALDTVSCHLVHQKQLEELEEAGMTRLYKEEMVPLIKVYKNMDQNGVRVDASVKAKLNDKYAGLYEDNLRNLQRLLNNDKFNPRSPKQLGTLIYDELKFPKRVKTDEFGKKTYKTDKDTLDDLTINHALDNSMGVLGKSILQRIIVCRKIAKVIEYINTLLHPDGRLHASSNLAGTETGRSSYSKSLDEILVEMVNGKATKKLGRSLQTITKHGFTIDEETFDDWESKKIADDLRSMFVPSPGYTFVEIDGSQAEARDVAVLAEDYELLASFDRKPKVHAKTASLIFGIPAEQITKDSPTIPGLGIAYYDLGKRIRHAGHYNMGGFRLAQMTHLPLPECDRMLFKFHEGNPKIRNTFHREVEEIVRRHRWLRTALTRRRDFFAHFDNKLVKEALAFLPQSRISDHTKFSLRRIMDEMPWVRPLAEAHDGIFSEVPKGRVEEYSDKAQKIYERPCSFLMCSLSRDIELVIPAEVSVSEENWMSLE